MPPTATLPLPLAPPHATRPLLPLLGLALAVLMVHALLLTGLPAGLRADSAVPPPALSVRQIVQAAAPAAAEPAAVPTAAPSRPARPRLARPAAPEANAKPAAAAPEPMATAPMAREAEPPSAAAQTSASAPAATELAADPTADPPAEAQPAALASALAASAPSQPAAAVPAAGDPPPTYATRLPPATLLRYELRRGRLTGQGELSWRPDAGRYELQIEGTAFGLPLLGWVSRGGFDAAGVAPQRFADRRRGRDLRAANFQRDKGLITYSGVAAEHPLLAGAQDRASWMVQLAAIVAADPARFGAGERISMLVSGARGDADVWAFAVTGVESVDIVGGRVDGTLALRREPRKPFDTQVEVWLDPARHHLPVRLKLSTAGGGDSLEFVLQP